MSFTNETESETVESPCKRLCFLSDCLTYCKGCGRTTEQIRLWWKMDTEERKEVLRDSEARKDHTLPSSNG